MQNALTVLEARTRTHTFIALGYGDLLGLVYSSDLLYYWLSSGTASLGELDGVSLPLKGSLYPGGYNTFLGNGRYRLGINQAMDGLEARSTFLG